MSLNGFLIDTDMSILTNIDEQIVLRRHNMLRSLSVIDLRYTNYRGVTYE